MTAIYELIATKAAELGASPAAASCIARLADTILEVTLHDDDQGAQVALAAAQGMNRYALRRNIIAEHGQFALADEAKRIHEVAITAELDLPANTVVSSEELGALIARRIDVMLKLSDNDKVVSQHALLDLMDGHATIMRGLDRLSAGVTAETTAKPAVFV